MNGIQNGSPCQEFACFCCVSGASPHRDSECKGLHLNQIRLGARDILFLFRIYHKMISLFSFRLTRLIHCAVNAHPNLGSVLEEPLNGALIVVIPIVQALQVAVPLPGVIESSRLYGWHSLHCFTFPFDSRIALVRSRTSYPLTLNVG